MRTSGHADATVLELGARGKHRGASFLLAGRTCVESDTGGLWNEWSVVFDDGRQAFLAEALGTFTLFFERPIAPIYEALAPGAPLATGFVVVERGRARRLQRWGDVPESPRTYYYADLSSAAGESATIDYGASERRTDPDVFVGRRVRLAELGLQSRALPRRFVPAPDGPAPKGLALWLAVGDEGAVDAAVPRARFRVIGILQRSIRISGKRYTWEEYVLHAPAEGLRWLVVSDGHWNLVEPVEAGQVEASSTRVRYRGTSYRPWSSGKARVEWATGELPFHVVVGDVSETRDYVHPPHMISCESSAAEVSWSYATYVPGAAVARAFGKRVLPKPLGRAPNQPTTSKRR